MVLIVGCGDLGGEIARLLSLAEHQVVGVRASNKPLPANIQTIQADVTQPNTLTTLENLKPETLIYCVAASEQSDDNYHAIYVQGLKNVIATQANNHALRRVIFVSSTRGYGQNSAEILDENTTAIPADFGGKRLLEAEGVLKQHAWEPVAMRLSGIYGKGRTRMMQLAKEPSRWPADNHYSNRIHRDDAARFIAFICDQNQVDDCYIVTDDMPTPQYEVLTWLAKQQNMDISSVQTPTPQGGKRLSNARMRATGFELRYPNYQIGYSEMLQDA